MCCKEHIASVLLSSHLAMERPGHLDRKKILAAMNGQNQHGHRCPTEIPRVKVSMCARVSIYIQYKYKEAQASGLLSSAEVFPSPGKGFGKETCQILSDSCEIACKRDLQV